MMDDDEYGAVSGINHWQGKPKYWENTCLSAALSTTDVLCVGSGLATGRCPIQGVLPIVHGITEVNKGQEPNRK
jgi:hypothetical protein